MMILLWWTLGKNDFKLLDFHIRKFELDFYLLIKILMRSRVELQYSTKWRWWYITILSSFLKIDDEESNDSEDVLNIFWWIFFFVILVAEDLTVPLITIIILVSFYIICCVFHIVICRQYCNIFFNLKRCEMGDSYVWLRVMI